MRSLLKNLLCLACLCAGAEARAQLELVSVSEGSDVIVRAHSDGNDAGDVVLQAIWRAVPGANSAFQLQRPIAAGADDELMLDKLMEAALGAYLDERIHFSKQGVTSDLPAARLAMEMNAMIFSALEGLGAAADMDGLSEPTRKQLDRLVKIDWSQARFGVDGGAEQDKYLAIYYYVRSQREELERQIRADLLPLAAISVLGQERSIPGRTVQVPSTCGTVFDDQNYLCALDLQLADTGSGGIDPELGSRIMEAMERSAEEVAPADQARVRKRDQWLKAELDKINQRIDQLDQRKELWELRDRMDDIEDRLTGLEIEVRDVKGPAPNDNPLSNLSDLTGHNITIRFSRNSTQVDAEYRVLLNEVFEQLARSPKERVLLTGYSDRSGDPAVNLKLSEQRAKSVRNYLLQRGISAERILVNYYGDSRSTVDDPSQRRVEVEWLRQEL